MFHLVARALPDTLLFRNWTEGLMLWRVVTGTFEGEIVALCVMPDHVHLILPHADPSQRLARAMAAFAKARNARRSQRGPVWQTHPTPRAIPDDSHLRRTIRYVHLNPCRARLASDPLAWPLSTHRDRVGFAAEPVVEVRPDPGRFHHTVSADEKVRPEGTLLPTTQFRDFTWEAVVDVASALFRRPPEDVTLRGPMRTIALKTAWAHGLRDRAFLMREVGVNASSLHRLCSTVPDRGAHFADPALEAAVRAVGDERFGALHVGDLRYAPAWWRYRNLR